NLVVQKVVFEWMPIRCSKCSGWGHKEIQCIKKDRMRQEWRQKKVVVAVDGLAAVTSGFGGAMSPSRTVQSGMDSKVKEALPGSGERDWTLVRKGSPGVGGPGRGGEGYSQCEGSGSRFRLLDDAVDTMSNPCRGEEIAAIVGQQLENILGPFPPPIS
ncbi:hypothetical protein Dimus_012976, partial [Dionaea muscipula]